jgi:hypothetical protein
MYQCETVLTLILDDVVHDGSTTRRDVPCRYAASDEWLGQERFELSFKYCRLDVRLLAVHLRWSSFIIAVSYEYIANIGTRQITHLKSESRASSIASAVSRSHLRSWFSF